MLESTVTSLRVRISPLIVSVILVKSVALRLCLVSNSMEGEKGLTPTNHSPWCNQKYNWPENCSERTIT